MGTYIHGVHTVASALDLKNSVPVPAAPVFPVPAAAPVVSALPVPAAPAVPALPVPAYPVYPALPHPAYPALPVAPVAPVAPVPVAPLKLGAAVHPEGIL